MPFIEVEYIHKVKVLRDRIVKTLKNMGYKVKVNSSLVGDSGVKHRFDIVASSRNKRLAIDFVSPSKDVNIATLASCAKAIDLKDTQTILVLPSNAKNKLVLSPKHIIALFYDDVDAVIEELGKIANL